MRLRDGGFKTSFSKIILSRILSYYSIRICKSNAEADSSMKAMSKRTTQEL